jgi:hypothetical protein
VTLVRFSTPWLPSKIRCSNHDRGAAHGKRRTTGEATGTKLKPRARRGLVPCPKAYGYSIRCYWSWNPASGTAPAISTRNRDQVVCIWPGERACWNGHQTPSRDRQRVNGFLAAFGTSTDLRRWARLVGRLRRCCSRASPRGRNAAPRSLYDVQSSAGWLPRASERRERASGRFWPFTPVPRTGPR